MIAVGDLESYVAALATAVAGGMAGDGLRHPHPSAVETRQNTKS